VDGRRLNAAHLEQRVELHVVDGKAIVRDPNGHVAEWILKELQVEAAKWKTEYTEAEHRAYYRYGREGDAQWEEPAILVELRRCVKLASGGIRDTLSRDILYVPGTMVQDFVVVR
jgi:hypothetical protein